MPPDYIELNEYAATGAAWAQRRARQQGFHRACVEARVGDDADPDGEFEEHDDRIAREEKKRCSK